MGPDLTVCCEYVGAGINDVLFASILIKRVR